MITKLKKKWGDTDFAVPRQGRKWMTSWQNHVLYTSCATSFVFPFVASFFVFDALKFSLNWVFTLIAFDKKENRPLCKMADDNSNKLKLAKTKNIYRHCKEHLYFSNPVRFQHFRCYISWENVKCKRLKIEKITDVFMIWLGVWCICLVIQTSVMRRSLLPKNIHLSRDFWPWGVSGKVLFVNVFDSV